MIIIAVSMLISACMAGIYMPKEVNVNNRFSYALLTANSDKDHKVFRGLDEAIAIVKVDDKSLFNPFYRLDYPQSAYLTPGPHRIHVRFHRVFAMADACLELNALAGESYVIRKRTMGDRVQLWLQNEKSGAIVGNHCGFEKGPPEKASNQQI